MNDQSRNEDDVYTSFIEIMFNTWDADEMAYMDRRVMHPSYGEVDPSE